MKVVMLGMLRRVLVTGREDAVGNLLVLLIPVSVMWRLTHPRHRPLLDQEQRLSVYGVENEVVQGPGRGR